MDVHGSGGYLGLIIGETSLQERYRSAEINLEG